MARDEMRPDVYQKPLSAEDIVEYRAKLRKGMYDRIGVSCDMGNLYREASFELASAFAESGAQRQSESLKAIVKALSTTGIVPVGGTTGADAIKTTDLIEEIQSTELDPNIYATTWKWIAKKPCKQDVVQLTSLDDYGGDDALGWVDETQSSGGLNYNDPTLERRTTPVKWLGQLGQVMRTALVVEGLGTTGSPEIGSAMELASDSRLKRLIKNANWTCLHGDNSINPHESNGIFAQISGAFGTDGKANEYNMAGQPISQDVLATIESFMYANGGVFTDLFAGPDVFVDLKKQLIAPQRTAPGENVTFGNTFNKYRLLELFGLDLETSRFHLDKHLDPNLSNGLESADANAPAAPSAVTVTQVSPGAPYNKWGTTLAPGGGTYYYAVKAVSSGGRSVVTAGNAAGTVTGSQNNSLAISRADVTTVMYYIYRGTSASNLLYLNRCACTGATTTFVDDGHKIPGTSDLLILSNQRLANGFSTVMFRQLWPIDKVQLPEQAMSKQFVYLMAGTVQLTKAIHCLAIRNVGRLDPSTDPASRTN